MTSSAVDAVAYAEKDCIADALLLTHLHMHVFGKACTMSDFTSRSSRDINSSCCWKFGGLECLLDRLLRPHRTRP